MLPGVEAWAIASGQARVVPDGALDEALAEPSGVVWLDLDHTDAAGMALLTNRLRYNAHAVEDCHTRAPVPKLHVYGDHIFLAVNGLARGTDGHLHFVPLKTFLSTTRIVTVMGPANQALTPDAVRHDLRVMKARLADGRARPTSAADLGHAISLVVLGAHEDLVSAAASRVTELERRVLVSTSPDKANELIDELLTVRHDLQVLRTNAAQNREVYSRLGERLAGQGIDASLAEDLRRGFEHVRTACDLEREYLQEVLDLFQTRLANELNRFVRQLTSWGAIGIAGTLIAGIYGMNFSHMPELDWRYGYPMALGLIVLTGLGLAAIFRRRGWL